MSNIECLDKSDLKELLIKKGKKELANALLEVRDIDKKLADDCIIKAKQKLKLIDCEPEWYSNVYIMDTCQYIGEFNMVCGTFDDCLKSVVKEITDDLLHSAVDEITFKNRFQKNLELILLESKTLKPEAKVSYVMVGDKPDILIDAVEHDASCLFFSNLANKYGNTDYKTSEGI